MRELARVPTASLLKIVVFHFHRLHRTDAGECVAHHSDERAIAEADELRRIDARQQCSHLLGGQHRRFSFFDAVPRTAALS